MPPADPPSPFDPDDPTPSGETDADVLARAVSLPVARPVQHAPGKPCEPMLLMELPRGACAGQLFLIPGLFVALSMLGGSVIFTVLGDDSDLLARIALPVTAAIGLLVAGVTVILFRWRGLSVAALGLATRDAAADVALGLLATVAAFGAFFLTVGVLYLLWPSGFSDMEDNPERIAEFVSPSMGLGTLFVLMIVVGGYEELLFRGVILTHTRRLTGSWFWAVLISSAVFGLSHAGMQVASAIIPLSAVGMVFAVIAIWRRSLIPVIIGHGIFNWLQLAAMRMYGGPPAGSHAPASAAGAVIRWLASGGRGC